MSELPTRPTASSLANYPANSEGSFLNRLRHANHKSSRDLADLVHAMPFSQRKWTTNLLVGEQQPVSYDVRGSLQRVECCSCRGSPSFQRTRSFQCSESGCGAKFFRKSTLTEYLVTHSGEKPFQYDVASCAKRFSTSGNLSRYRCLHTVKQFEGPARGYTRVHEAREAPAALPSPSGQRRVPVYHAWMHQDVCLCWEPRASPQEASAW